MIEDYKEIASKFSKDFIGIVDNGNFTTLQKYNKLQSLFSICTQLLVELSDEYENLEADYDECLEELSDAIEENKTLRTCFINHSEIISEQRCKIKELEYIINDLIICKELII